MAKAYTVYMLANLPFSGMPGYMQRFEAWTGADAFDYGYGEWRGMHQTEPTGTPEAVERWRVVQSELVAADSPYEAISRFRDWQQHGWPRGWLTKGLDTDETI